MANYLSVNLDHDERADVQLFKRNHEADIIDEDQTGFKPEEFFAFVGKMNKKRRSS